MGRHYPPQFAVGIAGEFHRAGLGEMHPIGGAQAANLTFKVRTLHRITSLLVDETIPEVDIGDPGFFGALAIELVEIAHVAGGFRAADRWQSYPNDRRA